MSEPIYLGISTCPNDTFAFHGLLERKVDWRGFNFRVELLDIEQLNQRLFAGQFDAAKASFHAALLLADEVRVLPAGAALGFGVGPLLLAAQGDTLPGDLIDDTGGQPRPAIVLCPGAHTTGALLYRLFHPGEGEVRQQVFSEIMPQLQRGEADFGVCIHEGRFTWRENGLHLVEDLGQVWEQATSVPLPLGGIVARNRLGAERLNRLHNVVRESIEYGLAHRDETLETMRKHAQAMSEEVMFAHVDLYVNQWTVELGSTGRQALATLATKAVEAQLAPPDVPALQVVGAG